MKDFEIIEHTADTGVRAFGATVAEAFINAARGMFSIIAGAQAPPGGESFAIEVEAGDREALLVAWLSELLYLYDSRNALLGGFTIDQLSDTALKGRAWGEAIDVSRHQPGVDIKAVTWHMLSVRREENGWVAEVIFDV